MNQQQWNATQYHDKVSYVTTLGSAVLELLNTQLHEVILDLGCGDGVLTQKIAERAKEVIGIDASESMVQAARAKGLNAFCVSGEAIPYRDRFDAVFSNAALHWMRDYQAVISGVHQALKPQGRFVAECGGFGNIQTLVEAMETVVHANSAMGTFVNPWFFPTAEMYKDCLEQAGFAVLSIELFPRPTVLTTGVRAWLKVFANHVISGMPEELESEFLSQTEALLKPTLFTEEKGWVADYVRLRFQAVKV